MVVKVHGCVQELEGERDTLEEALRSERDKRDQQAMSLRQEAAAVQMAADDDKQRTCGRLSLLPCTFTFCITFGGS